MNTLLQLLMFALPHMATMPANSSRSLTPAYVDTLATVDRVRLREAYDLARSYSERAWSGWGATAFPVLLISGEREFLIAPLRAPAGFTKLAFDTLLQADVYERPRVFPPGLLATFPLADATPVVVIGRAEATGKSPAEWILTLLHEHFHQLQFAQPGYYAGVKALNLARGDTTGMWALNFNFPYDSSSVQQRFGALTRDLVAALDTTNISIRRERIASVRASYEALRAALSADEARYLDFQLWQEGVARYTEYRLASLAAADEHATPFHGRPWRAVRDSVFRAIVRGTARSDLAKHRREVVYPVGAAIAIVLDADEAQWRDRYFARPFSIWGDGRK